MKRNVLLLFVVLITCQLFAQLSIPYKNGKFTFQQVTASIIKATYQPKGYSTNEAISDAVILKPKTGLGNPTVKEENGNLIIANKVTITGINEIENYKGFLFALTADEKVFGGGERALPLNRRGYKLDLYNATWYGYGEGADHLNYSVPFFTSSNGYALFFDNVSKSYVDIGKKSINSLEYGASSGALTFYIILGADYKTILHNYYTLTGTQPLPPRWALGNLMSRFGYTSQAQVTDIYAKMKAEHIPVDGIIFDLFWFGDSIKNGLGNLDWVNKTKWPNPKEMIAAFRKDNVNTILVTEPFIVKNTLAYNSAKPFLATDSIGNPYQIADFYFGNAGLVDVFRKDARNWFWHYYKKQMDLGVEAWWGDLGEPEMHPKKLFHNLKDLGYKRPFGADEVHNAYGHNWTKMLFEKYAVNYPNKRLFSLNRSGFAGTQRYSIFPWTGDVSRSWSGLRAQLPVLLGMSMSGVPYVHSDAGGFAGGEGDNELYVRWLQMAAFTPIFRPHGTALYDIEKAAFSFPSEPALIDEPYRTMAKKVVNQRYQFLAYNYSLAYQQTVNKQPLMRPLYYENPTDTTASSINNEYYWGDNVIVAPVLEKGVTNRSVYLPKGDWYIFNSNEKRSGGSNYNEPVTIQAIPIFIKAGTILPLFNEDTYTSTTALKNDKLTIAYYPSVKKTSFTLYEDDGSSKNAIGAKQFQLVNFSAQTIANKEYVFTIQSNGGNYIGKAKRATYNFIINEDAHYSSIIINGKKQNITARNENKTIRFPVKFTGEKLTIEVK